jgi:UDP-N-acetylglucosamine:LPS N-acetylglucosamine transferase
MVRNKMPLNAPSLDDIRAAEEQGKTICIVTGGSIGAEALSTILSET